VTERADRAAGAPVPVRRPSAQVIVIAKEPVAGRVKTRLTPPFTPLQAALLAEAALSDTLHAVAQVSCARHLLALDGVPGRWLPPGFDVIAQRGHGLDERIAAAFDEAYADLPVPVVLIGMDTPQVTASLLELAIRPLADGSADAVLGPANDGGFWLLGLRQPDPTLVDGVPMSTAGTGAAQLARLEDASLRVLQLSSCTDVDDAAGALAVAAAIPGSRFAATMRAMRRGRALAPAMPPPHHAARPGRSTARRAGRIPLS
jgi:uncharacterized protein